MTGSNPILAIVVGAIVVIVAFSLWPVLNASSNQLYSYFRTAASTGLETGSSGATSSTQELTQRRSPAPG